MQLGIFLIIYLVGVVLFIAERTIASEYLSDTSLNIILILTPIALMGVYLFFVLAMPATKLRLDLAADNIYYLGFLYTLTSLATALVFDSSEVILSNFGVAISSTLFGIVARVCINQLKVDPVIIEEAARLELAESSRRLVTELDQAVLHLRDFQKQSLQVMSEGYAEVQTKVEKISADLFTSLEETVEKSTGPLSKMAENTRSASDVALNALDKLTKSNENVTQSYELMATSIATVNQSLDLLSKRLSDPSLIDDKITGPLNKQIETIQTILNQEFSERFNELTQTIEVINSSHKEVGEKIVASIQELLKGQNNHLYKISDEIKILIQSIKAIDKSHEVVSNRILESVRELLRGNDKLPQAISGELKTLNQSINAINSSQNEVGEKIRESVQELLNQQPTLPQEVREEFTTLTQLIEDTSRSHKFADEKIVDLVQELLIQHSALPKIIRRELKKLIRDIRKASKRARGNNFISVLISRISRDKNKQDEN